MNLVEAVHDDGVKEKTIISHKCDLIEINYFEYI